MAGPKHMKEDSTPWPTACGLARDGLPPEAERLYRFKKQLDKFREEKQIHRGQLNTKVPPLSQKVTALQIAGGWGTVMGGCFTTCLSCSYTLPTTYFGHCSVQNILLDGHLICHCMALLTSFIPSVNYWTSTIELQWLKFKHWLHIVTVSPLWTNALGIKSRHCFEHTMERIQATLFQILLFVRYIAQWFFTVTFPLQQWKGRSCPGPWVGQGSGVQV